MNTTILADIFDFYVGAEEKNINDAIKSERQRFLEWIMSDESATQPPFFNQKDLLKRGWSKDLIARLLGDPDWKKENPHYPGASPMRCWRQDRVLAAEGDPAFQEFRRRGSKTAGMLKPRPATDITNDG